MARHIERKSIDLRGYVLSYVALLVLATVSWAFAELRFESGLAVALVIAVVKAVIVLAAFMHLAEESFAFQAVITIATLLVLVLVGLTVVDPMTRGAPALDATVANPPR